MQSKWMRVKLNNLQDDRIDEHPNKGRASTTKDSQANWGGSLNSQQLPKGAYVLYDIICSSETLKISRIDFRSTAFTFPKSL